MSRLIFPAASLLALLAIAIPARACTFGYSCGAIYATPIYSAATLVYPSVPLVAAYAAPVAYAAPAAAAYAAPVVQPVAAVAAPAVAAVAAPSYAFGAVASYGYAAPVVFRQRAFAVSAVYGTQVVAVRQRAAAVVVGGRTDVVVRSGLFGRQTVRVRTR